MGNSETRTHFYELIGPCGTGLRNIQDLINVTCVKEGTNGDARTRVMLKAPVANLFLDDEIASHEAVRVDQTIERLIGRVILHHARIFQDREDTSG